MALRRRRSQLSPLSPAVGPDYPARPHGIFHPLIPKDFQMQRSRTISLRARFAVACATAAVAVWTSSIASAAPLQYRTVALTATDGQYGPGEGAGITFASLTSVQPAINTAGQVVFRGTDSTTGNPNGLWMRTGNANSILAINGGPQPGGGTYPTGASGLFNSYHVNNAGQSAWRLAPAAGRSAARVDSSSPATPRRARRSAAHSRLTAASPAACRCSINRASWRSWHRSR